MATNPHFPDVYGDAPPSVGHNNPPPDQQVVIDFNERLFGEDPELRIKLDELLGACERVEVTNDDELARAGDLDVSLRHVEKRVIEAHKDAKEPYLTATRAVDTAKREFIERIVEGRQTVKARSSKFLNERDGRVPWRPF